MDIRINTGTELRALLNCSVISLDTVDKQKAINKLKELAGISIEDRAIYHNGEIIGYICNPYGGYYATKSDIEGIL